MYEVMARRYRPARFEEVVGQEHIALTLKNAIARDRVAHAYMFTGGHGCGKTTMARILAKALVCVDGPTPEPCGKCPICLDVAAGRDSDVLEIDGASNNGIEQIRQLREQAGYVPTRARFKIYIIDEVHMLSDGAFNALLKTLEEPPRHVKFILATTDPHKVPDTILSRCQRFDFRLVPQAKLVDFFRRLAGEEKAAISEDGLEAVAAFAEGSVRDGLVLLDQLLSFSDGEVTRRDVESVRGVAAAENVAAVFDCIARNDVRAALAVVDEVASRGTNVGDFLDQLINFGRDLMLVVASGSSDGITSYGPAKEALLKLAETSKLETALLYLDVFTQARTRVRSRALSNPLVALEMAVARLAGLGGVTPVAEILAKLDDLPLSQPGKNHQPQAGSAAQPQQAQPAGSMQPMPAQLAPTAPTKRYDTASQPQPERDTQTMGSSARTGAMRPAQSDADTVALPKPGESDPNKPTQRLPGEAPPFNIATVEAMWDKVIDTLAKKNPADVRHMARVVLSGVNLGCVELSGPSTAIEAMQDTRRLGRLEEAAEETLGRPVSFEFSQLPNRRDTEKGKRDATGNRLMRHPTVSKVKDIFDGVVVNCQTTAPDEDFSDSSDSSETGDSDLNPDPSRPLDDD
ncbi:MAG: DNA polymerase III subunit gamma/tau [Planctomycetes bacterium]|nr:DNA polymerase III subunit gamma/tau [Planctomycetota bacterium]